MAQKNKLEVKNFKIDEIHPYENNPRNNEAAVDKVAASISEFGFKVPIIIDRENVIVAGHTRYLAAQKLELQKVPCIVADDLTPNQIKAFRLADNKVSEFSGWDFQKLNEELSFLGEAAFDLEQFGFLPNENVDFDSFLTDEENPQKKPKTITCPHCGKTFEK